MTGRVWWTVVPKRGVPCVVQTDGSERERAAVKSLLETHGALILGPWTTKKAALDAVPHWENDLLREAACRILDARREHEENTVDRVLFSAYVRGR